MRVFSIPLWSDFILLILQYVNTLYLCFSIPLWSDFIHTTKQINTTTNTTFQSHYGLILSVTESELKEKISIIFNPTMVWFYRFGASNARLYMFDFQSHYGLILSRWRHRNGSSRLQIFNPTMVWFYLYESKLILIEVKIFNPTMVWFYQYFATFRYFWCVFFFNPTMVWFYL